MRRIRWAHDERGTNNGIVDRPPAAVEPAGWRSIGASASLAESIGLLTRSGFSRPGVAAALCGNRHDRARLLARKAEVLGDADAALEQLVARRDASGGEAGIHEPEGLRRLTRRVDRALARGQRPPTDELAIRVGVMTGRARRTAQRIFDLLPETERELALQIEASLRIGIEPWPGWRQAAARALGEESAAERWATTEPSLPDDIARRIAHLSAVRKSGEMLVGGAIQVMLPDRGTSEERRSWLCRLFDALEGVDPNDAFWMTVRACIGHLIESRSEPWEPWAEVLDALDEVLPPRSQVTGNVAVVRILLDNVRAEASSSKALLNDIADDLSALDVDPMWVSSLRACADLVGADGIGDVEEFSTWLGILHRVFDTLGVADQDPGDWLARLVRLEVQPIWTVHDTLAVKQSVALSSSDHSGESFDEIGKLLEAAGLISAATDMRRLAVREARKLVAPAAGELVGRLDPQLGSADQEVVEYLGRLDRRARSHVSADDERWTLRAMSAAVDPRPDRLRAMEVDTQLPARAVALAQVMRELWRRRSE